MNGWNKIGLGRKHGKCLKQKVLHLCLPVVIVNLDLIKGVDFLRLSDEEPRNALKQAIMNGHITFVEVLVNGEAFIRYGGLTDESRHSAKDGLP